MLEAALIGYGKWGQLIESKLEKRDDVSLCYVCDLNEIIKEKLKTKRQSPFFVANYKSVRDVDIAFIATYPQSHGEITQHFLQRGCDVFVEKPAALSVTEIEKIRKIAEMQDRKVAVGLQEIFNNKYIEEALRNKEVKEIVDHRNIKHPYLSGRLLGCSIHEDLPHIHFMQCVNSLFGIRSGTIESKSLSENSIESHFMCENGISSIVRACWVDNDTDRYIEFRTSEGDVRIELGKGLKINNTPEIVVGDKVSMLVNDFVESVKNNREPMTSIQEEGILKTHADTLLSVGK